MTEEYKHGDEFKLGIQTAGAKLFRLEGEKQGREAFESGHDDEDGRSPKAKADRQQQQTQLYLNMLEYEATTARLAQQIDQAGLAAGKALEKARRRENEAQEALDELRRDASRTEDGRAVFLTADGSRAFDEDGNELTAGQMAGIDWKEGAPTWETYQTAIEDHKEARREVQEIEDYQERLQEGRDRLESGDTLTADELQEIQDGIENMPDSVREQLPAAGRPAVSAAREHDPAGSVRGEPINPTFAKAAAFLTPEEIAAVTSAPAPAGPKPA